MQSPETVGRHTRAVKLLVLVVVPALAVMAVAFGIALATDTPVSDLLRDPSATLDGAWYVGLFSMTGIALWAAAAAICMVALAARPPAPARALLVAGAVTSVMLGADDLYLIHETVKNDIGIPSPVTIGLYGVVAIYLFARVGKYLLSRPDVAIFGGAVAFFAVSVVLDVAGEAGLPTPPLSAILEDVAKFLGILTWTVFFAGVARSLIRSASAPADDPLHPSPEGSALSHRSTP